MMLSGCGKDENDYRLDSMVNLNRNATDKVSDAGRLEFPKLSGRRVVVHKTSDFGVNYALEWDDEKKSQRWSCLMMTYYNMKSNWSRNKWPNGDPFQPDPDIPSDYRTTDSDYRGTGFTRGHIVASADRLYSKYVNEQTFYYSNMQPMYWNFNGGAWEAMEIFTRNIIKKTTDTLYVCKGGTIGDGQTLAPASTGLLVPKYFFMALLSKDSGGEYKALGFWIEHTKESGMDNGLSIYTDYRKIVAPYVVSIDKLEELTGIDFFCNLPDLTENKVEANVYPQSWGI